MATVSSSAGNNLETPAPQGETPHPRISGSLGTELTRAGVGAQDSCSPPHPSAFLLCPNLFGGLEGGAAATEPVFALTRMVTSFMEVRGSCSGKHRAKPHISVGCPRALGCCFILTLILPARLSVQSPVLKC